MLRKSLTVLLPAPLPEFLVKDVCGKLAYVDERVTQGDVNAPRDSITLLLSEPVDEGMAAELDMRVRALVHSMAEGAFEPEMRILEEKHGSGSHSGDPMPELLQSRAVVQEGPGFFALGPSLASLLNYVDARLVGIADQFEASPYRFPALVPATLMERVQYFTSFPHSLSFVSHLSENLPNIERFAAEAKCEHGRVVIDRSVFAPPTALLSPTVCHHVYFGLENSVIDQRGFIATACGSCFRYEASNMVSLERLWNFTMREIVFVGDEDFVSDNLTKARTVARSLFDDLDLTFRVETANDPFFIGTYRDQAAYQAAFELKYEIRAALPYKGSTMAVGSYNRHGDFFGRKLNISDSTGQPVQSGCFAIGLERIVWAFLAQHGINPEGWPAAIRSTVRTDWPVRATFN